MTLANNTASSTGVSPRAGRRYALATLLMLAAAGPAACARSAAPPPQIAPRPVIVEPEPAANVPELAAEAERYYELGIAARDAGDMALAEGHFDAAVQVFLDADLPPGHEEEFRLAFNDIVTRVQAATIDTATEIPFDEATILTEQEIPILSPAEIEMLRARFADTLPALPRFSIPVPADNPRVLEAAEYLSTNRREVIQEGLARAARYLPMIHEIFEEAGVPRELAWMPLIESLFKPTVRSRASAVGLWQLMAPTARLYGLRVDSYVDERRDPVKATEAISRFILDYHQEFGDWHLAIAAYNGGKGRVARALERAGASDFWALASTRHLPRETREFVPKILAAILIGTEPEAYGLEFAPLPPYDYDVVRIDSMTDLEVIAEAAGTSLAVIQELNPQLLRRTTPNVSDYAVRVPAGQGEAFRVAFAAIPPSERLRVVEHTIRNGESLSTIAQGYGLSIAAIADFNAIRDRNRIRAGQTILIPVSQGSGGGRAAAVTTADLVQGDALRRGQQVVHTVRRGESLWTIARAYRTSVDALKRWNGLTSDRILGGDRLEVYYDTTAAAPAVVADPVVAAPAAGPTVSADVEVLDDEPPAVASYTVSRGDTLEAIARRHAVGIADLKRWNGLASDRIYPGDRLVIRGGTGDALVETRYTIRRGDTLSAIARSYGVTIRQICDWNGITPRTTLYPGRSLTIRSRVVAPAR